MRIVSKIQSNFSLRVSFWVIVQASIIYLLSASVSYYHSMKTIKEGAATNATLTMENATSKVNNRLENIAKSIDNIAAIIQNGEIPADTLYALVKYIVAHNSDIVGSAVAFEPNHFPNKGYYFSPYAWSFRDNIYTKQLGNEDYDYFSMEWYSRPKELGKSAWSSPYYDDGGGEMMMSTYSSVMYDRNGKFLGVVTADISLDWLRELVSNLRPYSNSYAYVLDANGSFIIHDTQYYSPRNTIFTVAESVAYREELEYLGNEMLAGHSGLVDMPNASGEDSQVSYSSIPQSGWSMAMVSTMNDVFEDLNRSSFRNLIIAVLGLLFLFATSSLIIKRLTKPLHSFSLSAKQIAHGDFDVPLPVIKSQDEMRELHDSFDYMQHELVRYMSSLSETVSAKERIESELRIASDIQMSLVPNVFPERADISIYGMLRPAKEVGGDLYDFFIEDNKLFFIIGDVSDKGVPAAMVMAIVRSCFRNIAPNFQDNPKGIIDSLNRIICENNDANMFVTMIVGILDLVTGKIDYCNAGHDNPCLIDREGQSSVVITNPGLPIGIIPDADYTNEQLILNRGETLFLYTDGLNEAKSAEGKYYGEDYLVNNLNFGYLPSAKEVIEKMGKTVEDFTIGAIQNDDITMLNIQFFGVEPQYDNKFTWTFNNNLEELHSLMEKIEALCESQNIDASTTMQIKLALEEVVVNIINYAYPDDGKDYTYTVSCTCAETELCFEITDGGKPFDPTSVPEADINLPVEERQIGGLGVFLVKEIMNSVNYRYEDNKNILTIKKLLN